MNAKKILSLTVLTFSAVTVIVACGPKDRAHVDVTKGHLTGIPGVEDKAAVGPEKITAVPKNVAAKLELSIMKADKVRLEMSKKILASVKDVTMVQILDKVRVRVARSKNLKNDLPSDKQVLMVEVPATSPDDKLEILAPQTSDLGEIKVYYDPTSKAVDTIKITDTADRTASYFVMFKAGFSGAIVTPKISGDKKALSVSQAATQPSAVGNLKTVFKALQEAQVSAAQPYLTELRAYLDKDNQSLFETLIIPVGVPRADNLMPVAVDASQSLVALSYKLSKTEKSVSVANLLVEGQGGDALSLPNTLGINIDFNLAGSDVTSNELDVMLAIHGTGAEVVPWTLHVSRVAAGAGKLLKFSDADEDAALPAAVASGRPVAEPISSVTSTPASSSTTSTTLPLPSTLVTVTPSSSSTTTTTLP